MNEIRYTPGRITHLNENEVFVFGSNLGGMQEVVQQEPHMRILEQYGAKV